MVHVFGMFANQNRICILRVPKALAEEFSDLVSETYVLNNAQNVHETQNTAKLLTKRITSLTCIQIRSESVNCEHRRREQKISRI